MVFGGGASGSYRARGKSPREWDQCPYKSSLEKILRAISHVRVQQEDHDFGGPGLRNGEKWMSAVYEPLSLWHSD